MLNGKADRLESMISCSQDWKQEMHFSTRGIQGIIFIEYCIVSTTHTLIRVEEVKFPESHEDFLGMMECIFSWSFQLQALRFLLASLISFE